MPLTAERNVPHYKMVDEHPLRKSDGVECTKKATLLKRFRKVAIIEKLTNLRSDVTNI